MRVAEVCASIKLDFTLPRFSRTKQAAKDRDTLLAAAGTLRQWLDSRYQRRVESSNPDVVTRQRRFGTSDYIFAVNDRREAGTYVGNYGLVMEDGLPTTTTIQLRRSTGFVYDLVEGQATSTMAADGALKIPVALGPCEGKILLVTERPIQAVNVTAPSDAMRGESVTVEIAVTDGNQAIDAVVPLSVHIFDPAGREAEFTGFYGAAAGVQSVNLDLAPNDRPGIWTIKAKELASGKSASAYVRVR